MAGKSNLTQLFSETASSNHRPAQHETPTQRRLPVSQRGENDFKGDAMRDYINGLESRLINHIRKHAPHWHNEETRKVLRRWNMPGLNHPKPSWATPTDVLQDARDYAASLLRDRLVSKMTKIHDIRVARYLGGYRQVDPLHLIFHDRTTELKTSHKRKL